MLGGYQLIDLSNYPLTFITDGLEITDKEIISKFKVNKPKRVLFIIETFEYELILNQFDKDGVSVAKLLDLNSDKWYDVVVLVNDNNVSISFTEVTSGGGGGSSFPVSLFVADLKNTDIGVTGYSVSVPGIYSACTRGYFIIFTNWRCLQGNGTACNPCIHKRENNEFYFGIEGEHNDAPYGYINQNDEVYTNE